MNTTHYTVDDYYELGEHGERKYIRWELIKGIFKMSPAPLSKHQGVSGNLYFELRKHFKKRKCKVMSAPFDVRLAEDTIVQPDLCVICDMKKITRRGCSGAPDLIVEILSNSTEKIDEVEKLHLYEEYGVKEYWITHPEKEWVKQYVLAGDKFELSAIYEDFGDEDVITSRIFPELEIKLCEIFE